VKRALKIVALVLVVLFVLFGAYVGYLLTSNSYPRPEAGGWARLNDLPRPRGEGAAAIALPPDAGQPICPKSPCAPQFFVIGGLSGLRARAVSDVDILDAGNGRWRRGPSLPEPRHHPAAASIDGAVYVSGGAKSALRWAPQRQLWVLRPGQDSWDQLPDMPEGRWGHAMIAVGGKLYVIGGRGQTSRILIYDLASGWTTGAPMPQPRDHLTAVAVQGRIYAIGGRDSKIRSRVDIYDIATGTWMPGPPLPRPTSAAAAELLRDGRIHVVGGEDPGTFGGGVIDRHYVLDLNTKTWTTGPPALLAVHGAASDEVSGILLIVGGSRRQGAWSVLAWTGVTQRYDPLAGGGIVNPLPSASPTPSPNPAPTLTVLPS
jgi:hypothetical protein